MLRTPLRVLIVDDEPPARRRLKRLLASMTDVRSVGEAADAEAALAQCASLCPDVVLLDVQMPGASGIDVALALPLPRPHIIFVTAFERHAVRAFELNALDYLLKPVTGPRLAEAFSRVRRAGRADLDGLEGWHASGGCRWIPVRRTGRVDLVDVSTIEWCEAADNYVVLHMASGTALVRETLTHLLDALDPTRFLRVHRSAAVAIVRVRALESAARGDWVAVMASGARVPVSRTFRAVLFERISKATRRD